MKENSFIIKDDKGNDIKYDVLLTFQMEETKKDYIVYTDNTIDKEGNIQVYASTYNPNDEKLNFGEITTEKEWKTIDTILTTVQEELKNNENN